MDLSTSLSDIVTAILAELGIPESSGVIQTMLMRDGYFVGHKLRYDGGHAIWLAGGSTIEFYDEKGELLKIVTLEAGKGAAA